MDCITPMCLQCTHIAFCCILVCFQVTYMRLQRPQHSTITLLVALMQLCAAWLSLQCPAQCSGHSADVRRLIYGTKSSIIETFLRLCVVKCRDDLKILPVQTYEEYCLTSHAMGRLSCLFGKSDETNRSTLNGMLITQYSSCSAILFMSLYRQDPMMIIVIIVLKSPNDGIIRGTWTASCQTQHHAITEEIHVFGRLV